METIKKLTIKLGNSAGVLLPKEWLNTIVEVRIVKEHYTEEKILKDLNKYLKEYFKNILGIYLIGSYARGDFDPESDVDVLIVTDNINKMINIDNYEIILISEEKLHKTLSKNLYLASAIRESKTIINQKLLNELKNIKIELDINEHIKEIEGILRINKEMIETANEINKNILDGTSYSLVLRFRELYLIKCILKNKKPDKKEFLRYMPRGLYNAYLRVKRDEEKTDDVDPEIAEKLYDLTIKWLKELKD